MQYNLAGSDARRSRVYSCVMCTQFKYIVGGLVNFLSVIDVGEISCTGCISNRKKPFKITCLNRVPVLRFFFQQRAHLFTLLIN